MPTYEYLCPSCGHRFDLFQRMSDEPGADCPECGQAAERQFSAGGGFIFKGDGFYITDYRSDSYKKAAKQEASKAGGGDSAGSSGGSSKDKGTAKSPSSSSSSKPSGGSSGGSSSKGKG